MAVCGSERGPGLLHVHKGKTDQFTQPDGLSSDSIRYIFEDREGNVWVCTNNGLDRFHDLSITAIPVKEVWLTPTLSRFYRPEMAASGLVLETAWTDGMMGA